MAFLERSASSSRARTVAGRKFIAAMTTFVSRQIIYRNQRCGPLRKGSRQNRLPQRGLPPCSASILAQTALTALWSLARGSRIMTSPSRRTRTALEAEFFWQTHGSAATLPEQLADTRFIACAACWRSHGGPRFSSATDIAFQPCTSTLRFKRQSRGATSQRRRAAPRSPRRSAPR